MNKDRLNLANNNAKNLLHELNNTFHVPIFLWQHAELLITEYKEIIEDLLLENRMLIEDIKQDFNI